MTKMNQGALAAHMAKAPSGVVGRPRAEAGNVAEALKELKASVGDMRESVMPKAEKALKEAERTGKVSDEVKSQLDEIMPKWHAAQEAQSKLEGKLEALESRATDIEQSVVQGARQGAARPSAGREIAQSDQLRGYVSAGRSGAFEMDVHAEITTAGGSGGGLIWSDREAQPVQMARRELLIRDLLNVVPTGAGSVEYTRQTTRDNQADMVAETSAAPQSSYGWTKQEVFIRKVAHVTHVSEEALADSAQLEGEINGELAYGLDLVEEQEILAGDGTGEHLDGLLTNATAFSAASGLPDEQRIDRLRLAILQVTLNDYAADAIVLNPTDWAAIELLKDTQQRYLFGVPGNPGAPALWRLPVVASNSMTSGEWLVGAMRMAATLYDRMQNTIRISSEHGNNFVEGMLTMKGTKRVGLAVKRPMSLVTGDFTFT